MSTSPSDFFDLSDTELLESLGGAQFGSSHALAIESEFRRRALVAQVSAAKSTEETAKWTRYSALAITLSVIVMALGTFV